jgi:hypothetical protein
MKTMKNIFLGAVLLTLASAANAQIASGGGFTLEKSVIASGGASNLSGGAFTVGGTAGQISSGNSDAGSFFLRGGFWAIQPLAPTAASVSIGGRVLTDGGAGIRNVIVTLTDSRGAFRTTSTGTFGMYRFEAVEVGETYILTVTAKKYVFANPSQIVAVNEELANLDFVADGQ